MANTCPVQGQKKYTYLMKQWGYRLIMPLLMVMYVADYEYSLENRIAGHNWLIPLVFLLLMLAADRWRPALLLVREDILIAAALLISPLMVIGADWLSHFQWSNLRSYMNSQGFFLILFMTALYLRCYHEKEFYQAIRMIAFVLWLTAVIGLWSYLMYYLENGSASYRLYEPFGHPIIAAHCWIMGLWMPITGRRVPDTLLKMVNLIAIFLTQSRSSWIALAGTVVLFLFHQRREIIGFIKSRKLWQILAALFTAAAAICGFLLTSYGQKLLTYVENILLNRLTNVTDSHAYIMRTTHWPYILRQFFQSDVVHLLFGYGQNGVRNLIVESGMETSEQWLIADNAYISLTYECGLIAAAAIVIVIIKAFIQFMRTKTADELLKNGTLALIGTFAVIFFYDVQTYQVILLPVSMLAAETLVDYRTRRSGLPVS